MKIAIAGYGAEGKSNYDYWSTSDNDVVIIDEREIDVPTDANVITGEGAFARLNGYDMVVRTAGLAPRKIVTDGRIWSATNEFFAQCPAPIIGVTGTKGKGTTSSLIASIIGAAERNVHLVGNIGVPALSLLHTISPEDIVVFELSSYQLWDIQRSPHIAVVLLIEPDHLNVHADMDDYVGAKANITAHQHEDDCVIYHPTNHYSAAIARGSAGQQIAYGTRETDSVSVQGGSFVYNGEIVCSVDDLRLIGQHNTENACAAITVAKKMAITNEAITEGLRQFSGLPHRLEFVREHDNVRYFNDSFSSAPSAAVAAVKSFAEPELLILGGIDKGADFADLAQTLREASNIREIFVVGEIRHKLRDIIVGAGVSTPVTVLDERTMPEVVARVQARAAAGDVVILSPACASFDMFRDFYDRGDQFREVVQTLS